MSSTPAVDSPGRSELKSGRRFGDAIFSGLSVSAGAVILLAR